MSNGVSQDMVLSCIESQQKLVTKNIGKDHEFYRVIYAQSDQMSQQLSIKLIHSLRQGSSLQALKKTQSFDPEVKLTNQAYRDELEIKNLLIVKTLLSPLQNIFSYLRMGELEAQRSYLQKKEIISKVITKMLVVFMRETNYQLLSSQAISIVINQQEFEVEIYIDKAVIAGMDLLMYGEAILLKEYEQIFELLTLENLTNNRLHNFTYNLKIRSLAKILLQLCFGKKISFLSEFCRSKGIQLKKEELITIERCQKYSKELSSFFSTILQNNRFRQMVESLQISKEVNYNKFLWQVFVEQKQLSWTEVIELLVPQKKLAQEKFVLRNQLIPFQEIMKQLQINRQRTFGEEYIKKLYQLGLYDQPKPLFIALMAQAGDFAQQAIGFKDINQLLYCRNTFDYAVRDQLFTFLMGLLGQLTHLRPCLRAKQYINSLSDLQYRQKNQQNRQENQELNILLQNMQLPSERSQLSESVLSIIENFGKFETKIFKSRFITQNYYSSGLRKLRKSFR